jgi:hypothetical protein
MKYMSKSSFFRKVMTFLAEVNKGKHGSLIESGWLSEQDIQRITIILHKLGCIDKSKDNIIITQKGLNILLYQKTGKLGDVYNKDMIEILTAIT